MSLSTLQAQLAALSGRTKNPGSVYASSKRHDQAVGRGLHFSVQHGHSVQTKFAQPSLLAASAKEAADTPLQTLAENCRTALTELSSLNPSESQFWLSASRICSKDNVQYKVVQELLVHLSVNLCKTSSVNASWHVLEYLLRRYELHLKHFEDLLWTLWPSADQHPAIFLRALKFIDLGEHPSYMWLRAYTTSETIPPRQQLSQHVMKHKDLLKKVCTWSSLTAELSGSAPVLSFTAAVVVEGLAWAQKQGQEDLEGISKIIFPTVLNACGASSEDWKGWGWVVSSVLVETMHLSVKYLEILTAKILEDHSVAAVMVVISLLSPQSTESSSNKHSLFLPLMNGSHLGCGVLPKETREKLIQIPGLASILGELHREVVVAPLVAALVVGCLYQGTTGPVIELIQEKSLEPLWKGNSELDLVASLAFWIVDQVLQGGLPIEMNKPVLRELHGFDPTACERGIGKGIQLGVGDQQESSDIRKKKLLSLLDGVIELTTTESPLESVSLDMLPARVGIEHADTEVRLQAITRLLRDDNQDDLLDTFLRRWASEDRSPTVALAACNATIDCLQQDISIFSINNEQALQWALEACVFWSKEFAVRTSDSGVKGVFCKSLIAAGLLCSKLTEAKQQQQHQHWKSLVQVLVAHISCKDGEVSSISQKAFLNACGKNSDLSGDSLRKAVSRCLHSDMDKWMTMNPHIGPNESGRSTELSFRHRSIVLLIETIITSKEDVENRQESINAVFRFCLELLKGAQPRLDVIRNGLGWYIENQKLQSIETVKTTITLCSVGSDETFEHAVLPSIRILLESVRDETNQAVSPLAVALEAAARRSIPPKASLRLLAIAKTLVQENVGGPWLAVVPVLSLIEQSEQRIQEESKALLAAIAERMESDSLSSSLGGWESISVLCRSVSSSITWTGESIVSRGLSACSEEMGFEDIQTDLLTLSYFAVIGVGNTNCTASSTNLFKSKWLPLGSCKGGENAASNLFRALETTSEDVLPLLMQWKAFGRPLIDLWLGTSHDHHIETSCLVDVIVRMLLGAKRCSSKLMIVSGPGHSGRRARSYSFGKGDESPFLTPYPQEMLESIIAILSSDNVNEVVQSLASSVVSDVLAKLSWQEHVYKKLTRHERNELCSSILKYVGNAAFMVSDDFFTSLPLDCVDVLHLMQNSNVNMTSIILLADFVRANANTLFTEEKADDLCTALLKLLSNIEKESAPMAREDLDKADFALMSVIHALNEAFSPTATKVRFNKKGLQTLSEGISSILSSNENNNTTLPSSRTRSAAQQLLTSMCGLYPVEGVPLLIPVIISAFESCEQTNIVRLRQSLFSSLVPVYVQSAESANMSLHHLLKEVVHVMGKLRDNDQKRVLNELSDAIATCAQQNNDKKLTGQNATIGTLVAEFLSSVVKAEGNDVSMDTDVTDLCVGMISRVPVVAQASSILLFLHYVEAIAAIIQDDSMESDLTYLFSVGSVILPSALAICSVSLGRDDARPRTDIDKIILWKFMIGTLRIVNEALNLPSIRKLLRKNNPASSFLSLQLWQNTLTLESSLHAMGYNTVSGGLQSSVSALVDDCRLLLQEMLPIPLFLASSMSVIREGSSDQLRVNALRLIAERSLHLNPTSAEFSLFLDTIPEVAPLLDIDHTESASLRQGAFILIEHLARSLPANFFNEKDKGPSHKQFVDLLNRSVQVVQLQLTLISNDMKDCSELEACCYSSLCGASLVRVLGPKCLPLLPKFIKALNGLLVVANSLSESFKPNILTEIRLSQLAAMRSILCIIEAVPQFVPSYLGSLLKPDSLLSPALYDIMSDEADCKAVVSIRDRLGVALSTKIPPRSFIPAASKAIDGCSVRGKVSLLSMLKQSVEVSSHSECSSQVKPIFSSIMNALEFGCSYEDRQELLQSGCDLFLAVVMKISEVQLRKLFVSFREWRGDFSKDDPEVGAEKRYAYWFVCSHLSKALRGIFLPCLAITFSDAVSELELAAMIMCKSSDVEKRGKKRRRVESQEVLKYGIESMRSLQPLCLCLEYSLTADAHQGGNWIRGDDNQKYEELLDPLGRLLQASIPADFPSMPSASSSFQSLILGNALQSGSVVGCLKALACAGGNEQLWKPLNHAVLEACGNETRSEVKKAGLSCLLSLIESLGDEYLVLVPECLPVLSELLEDSDEDVASLAKDIVTLAEEMLGESLESSLR